MLRAAQIIGVAILNVLAYPDSRFENLGMDSLKSITKTWIEEIQPDILIS
jgi:LmbE family N-acetylglucosaminyl deacetylase